MILNNTIIITLQDFQRHFDFPQFWAKRIHFVRDMHPDNIYYYDPDQVKAYNNVCSWIKLEESYSTSEAQRISGLHALSILAGKEVTQKDLSTVLVTLNFEQDIISVPAGKSINLPGKLAEESDTPSEEERLHKIEVFGDGDIVNVLIGGNCVMRLMPGDFVYVTEINGQFLRILPNKLVKGTTTMELRNCPGQFGSTLHLERFVMGLKIRDIEDITQIYFAKGAPQYNGDKNYTIFKIALV